jgi:L-asparagine oxygenase
MGEDGWIFDLDPRAAVSMSAGMRCSAQGRGLQIERDHVEMGGIGHRVLEERLPEELLGYLRSLRVGVKPPILVLRNCMDCGGLPPTPASGFADDVALAHVDAFLLGLYSIAGVAPMTYGFENDGRLARNVVPHPNHEAAETSWGSARDLSWHQDNNFQPFEFQFIIGSAVPAMPRYLAFMSIRNRQRVATEVLSSTAILRRLGACDIAVASSEAFSIAVPESVRAGRDGARRAALIVERDGVFYTRFDMTAGIRPMDHDAARALAAIRVAVCAAESDALHVILEPGDCLLLDNYRAMHRRKSFSMMAPGQGRWLRRIYGVSASGPKFGPGLE